MKIGIGIVQLNEPTEGGGDTFKNFFIDGLIKQQSKHQFYFFTCHNNKWLEKKSSSFHHVNIFSRRIKFKFLRTLIRKFINKFLRGSNFSCGSDCLDIAVSENPVDFMLVFPGFFMPSKVPYATIVWDCGPFEQSIFPEMLEQQNYYLDILKLRLPFASKIFIGTNVGKQEIARYFGIQEEKIKVVPFPVPVLTRRESGRLLERFDFKNPFLFYPAQFWAHKNHITILKAAAVLKNKYGLDFDVAFSGSDKGNEEFVKSEACRLGLEKNIHFCGFVSKEEVEALYSNAFSLVYATCAGPDNLPPLEAMGIGCPVISSKYPGAEEQLEGAALFFDTLDEEDLALKIKFLWENPDERSSLISRGTEVAKNKGDYVANIFRELETDLKKRSLWQQNP